MDFAGFPSSGRSYSVTITAEGGGRSIHGDLAVSRWRDDLTQERWGQFFYLRDIRTQTVWSAGLLPVPARPEQYEASLSACAVQIHRTDHGISSRMDVVTVPDAPVEIRRIALMNLTSRARDIEITSYMEVVIAPDGADLSHPVYSNLFVQTESVPDRGAIFCSRRPKSREERAIWLMHAVSGAAGARKMRISWETDRAKFLGRTRTAANPAALDPGSTLSNAVGAVLNPIVSVRTVVHIAPWETEVVAYLTGVADSRLTGLSLLDRYRRPTVWTSVVNRACAKASLSRQEITWTPPGGVSANSERPKVEAGSRIGIQQSVSVKHLKAYNGHGGFTPDGREYVIVLDRDRTTPLPWINVVSNPRFGFQISESGAGYTWSQNSRENKLTPWSNDPVTDPPGEVIYIKDELTGDIWTPTASPIRDPLPYIIRHGQGYSTFEHHSHGIDQRLCLFVPVDQPVKVSRLRLTNRSSTRRKLSVTYYAEWVLGVARPQTQQQIITGFDNIGGAMFAKNPSNVAFSNAIAFLNCPAKKNYSWMADRREFIGRDGSLANPAGLAAADLSGRAGAGLDPCAAQRVTIDLAPGQSKDLTFLLGEGRTMADVRSICRSLASPSQVERAFKAVRDGWDRRLGTVHVKTPEPAFDLMLNRWLLYQTLSCRIWSKSAFYQSGGAFGFRDQLQDSRALLYAEPHLMRAHILRSAARQFLEGDVQHWWHPPAGFGPRTRCSDDLVWLPYVVSDYVSATHDQKILDVKIPYLKDKPLAADEQERGSIPGVASRSGTLYEHCVKALDRAIRRSGRHGLPLIGSCDWNDGMNRVGHRGKGESVWMGWFLIDTLNRFVPYCARADDHGRVRRYRDEVKRLAEAIERHAWDGRWYRRAYTDNGFPLGSSKNDECQIDSLAQTWAVLSGAGRPDRIQSAVSSMERRLIRYRDKLILLLTPPFDRSKLDPGYIKGYVPGVRENGGQYTHAATWVVLAYAKLGDGNRALRLFQLLNPIQHARTPKEVEQYKVEPYVMAADVYGVEPHVGRGGWTWYTGSSGWMYRIGIENILGLKRRGPDFTVDPCIPKHWRKFSMTYRIGRSVYRIIVQNPDGVSRGVRQISLDGKIRRNGLIPMRDDGRTHPVRVILG